MFTASPLNCLVRNRVAMATVLLASLSQTVQAQNNTQRGATFGGITGAIAGALIGDNNGEAGAGAAIGGAIGAVAGGVLGNAKDKDIAYYQSRQQYGTPVQAAPVYAAPQPTGAVSYSDVIAMSRSGVGDGVILNQIQTRGVQRQPVVSDIITLHQQGVSEVVISAMQQARTGPQYVAAPQTTIVETTPVYVQPRIHTYSVPSYRPPHRHGYRGRPSYGIHIGH
ncbi:Glycine zipper [Neorhodopirellula lusitana]|uniref:Glycine zipper n=1 Tax=Neorhodopirellula lusitana TaxID=445327 RepID=A0ABY1QNI7_9BACT|nr:glycine zipper domain-containing protein [Neorhodopirellula lusitana]SMP76325.1 Glycine zipper [Neorhodopirellula lusitana]